MLRVEPLEPWFSLSLAVSRNSTKRMGMNGIVIHTEVQADNPTAPTMSSCIHFLLVPSLKFQEDKMTVTYHLDTRRRKFSI